jgi:acetyl-CoA C-acetyltransferase
MKNSIVIIAMARTPFGRFFGALRNIEAHSLGAGVVDEVVHRAGVDAIEFDALYAGVGMASGGTFTPARQALLQCVLPDSTPSLAIDRACCSGMSAIGMGWKDLLSGQSEMVICGGFESLSRTPILAQRNRKTAPGDSRAHAENGTLYDPLLLRSPVRGKAIADYTGEEALAHGVTREQQDAWALQSHQRYFSAEQSGFFATERYAINELSTDEGPRADTSLAKLETLSTIYSSPTITPGNAPGLSDGAAFVAMTTATKASEMGIEPLARIVDYVQVADGPTSGSYTPALGIARLLARNGLGVDDLDLLEINEAYAATPLVSLLKLSGGDASRAIELQARTNVHGGAVAIGHPLGASGARITMTLASALRASGQRRGAAAICGGFGQGDALLLELP